MEYYTEWAIYNYMNNIVESDKHNIKQKKPGHLNYPNRATQLQITYCVIPFI